MSRISFQRNTPEGWQTIIQRMAALNGLNIEPATRAQVVKYLSNNLGLAPEEAKPAAWEVERRLIDFKYTANADAEVDLQQVPLARPRDLAAPHEDRVGPADRDASRLVSARRQPGVPPRRSAAARSGVADGRPPDNRHPVEKALDHLVEDVSAEDARVDGVVGDMRPARLDGTWALSGWELGKGAIYGRVTITASRRVAGRVHDRRRRIACARTGETVTRTGRAIVYTGFQWRGRSTTQAATDSSLREVMFVDRDWRTIEGRWFTGGYDEIGIDVKLERVGAETRVLGTDRTALRAGRDRPGAEDLRRQPAGVAAARAISISAPASRSRASSARRRTSRPSRSTSPPTPRSARAICSSPARRGRRRSPSTTRSTPSR